MNIDRFVSRNWFALLLVALHMLLLVGAAWITLDNAWNDMHPTFLLLIAFQTVDAPILWVLTPVVDAVKTPGTLLAATFVLGTPFWFAVGTFVTYACRALHQLKIGRRPAANGV